MATGAVRGHIVLVGMMGAGKSTVGELLARRSGHPFVDLDRAVEEAEGLSVSELFAARGEAAFRRLESDALGTALGADEVTVIATGGGVLLDPTNRTLVAPHRVVWLRAEPHTLAARLATAHDRPLLADGDAPERLAALAEARRGSYAEAASVVVEVDGRTPDDIVDELVGLLGPERTGGAGGVAS